MLRYCRVRQVGIKGNICGGGCRGHSSIVRGRVGISLRQTILLSTQQKGFSSRSSFFQGLVVRTEKISALLELEEIRADKNDPL